MESDRISHRFLRIHPGRLAWNLTIHPWKRRNIFQTIIFRFYVDLGGCIWSDSFLPRCAFI